MLFVVLSIRPLNGYLTQCYKLKIWYLSSVPKRSIAQKAAGKCGWGCVLFTETKYILTLNSDEELCHVFYMFLLREFYAMYMIHRMFACALFMFY
ncbi:hypothetical protein ACJX0J_036592, partial [Zea mays]